jgi:hypothetical protein
VERFADGEADAAKMAEVNDAAHQAYLAIESSPAPPGIQRTEKPGLQAAQATTSLVTKRANWCAYAAFKTSAAIGDSVRQHLSAGDRDPKWCDLLQAMCKILRDIWRNPFRELPALRKFWRTDTAVSLAGQMYESSDFSAMPILADALQDAGCEVAEVLGHCRGPGPHVRGCWCVDLLLNKS